MQLLPWNIENGGCLQHKRRYTIYMYCTCMYMYSCCEIYTYFYIHVLTCKYSYVALLNVNYF